MLISEKNGSFTVNVNGEEVMSTRSFGKVGKTYNSASEAFKDASYAYSVEPPLSNEYSSFWSVTGVLSALGFVLYYGINHF
jgi:hypothetical protein